MADGPECDAEVGSPVGPPLIVDMDHTVLRSDTLIEGIAAGLFQKPFSMALRLGSAVFSRVQFKGWVFENIAVNYDVIPTNEKLIEYLQSERQRGREIHLVSAAHQSVVDQVAKRFSLFDSAIGSSGEINLKGSHKLSFIRERFGNSFVYAGDSRPDMKVWAGATRGIFAGANLNLRRNLVARGAEWLEADFSREAPSWRSWVQALRPHQWSKNLLIFVPLLLSHNYFNVGMTLNALFGFLLLSVVASGSYLINDLSDLDADRKHRTKRHRPLASGSMRIEIALILAPLMILGGILGAWFIKPAFAIVLAAYIAVTLSYSLRLKRVALLDVFVLATLYSLRLVMGAIVIGVSHSLWLLTFSMFFFLSLSLAKRHVELASARSDPSSLINGRGYYPEDWPLTLSIGIAAGAGSILILVLYLVDTAWEVAVYQSPAYLGGIPVVIGFWTARIWLLAHRGELHDDPVAFAVKDPMSIAFGGALVALLGSAMFL